MAQKGRLEPAGQDGRPPVSRIYSRSRSLPHPFSARRAPWNEEVGYAHRPAEFLCIAMYRYILCRCTWVPLLASRPANHPLNYAWL